MLHPSYTELMSYINKDAAPEDRVVKSRYSIVMGTARRARQLVDNGYLEEDDHAKKPLSIAVDELYGGKIRMLTEAEKAQMEAERAEKLAAEETEAAEAVLEEAEAAEPSAEA